MKSRKTAVAASFLAISTILATLTMLVVGEPRIHLPGPLADAWRIAVILMIAYSLGMMLMMIIRVMSIKIDQNDQLTVPSYTILLGLLCSQIFIAIYIFNIIGQPEVGWPTPLGFITMLLIDMGVSSLTKRLGKMVERAGSRARVKLTMTDTSKPGPDIDLSPGATPHGVKPADDVEPKSILNP